MTNDFAPMSKGRDELNDAMTEIAQMQSLVGCADVLVRHVDDLNYDVPAVRVEHTNQILALIDSMNCKIDKILEHIEQVYEMTQYYK